MRDSLEWGAWVHISVLKYENPHPKRGDVGDMYSGTMCRGWPHTHVLQGFILILFVPFGSMIFN